MKTLTVIYHTDFLIHDFNNLFYDDINFCVTKIYIIKKDIEIMN